MKIKNDSTDPSTNESMEEVNKLADQAAKALASWGELEHFEFIETEGDTFQPSLEEGENQPVIQTEGTELDEYDVVSIEEMETLSEEKIVSILESLLFATDRPQSLTVLKGAFKNTQVSTEDIRRGLDQLQIEYGNNQRGVYLAEVAGGYQLRTKPDNGDYLRRMAKIKTFRVSGPALETLSIIAYKQPMTKAQVDEIRGVESGHLLRALMEKGLVHFAGKSELPGKPMLYGTTRRFLETFGLRNLQELPSLFEIDQLIPEGIGQEQEKVTLGDLTGDLSQETSRSYSEGEEELLKISSDLEKVSTTTDFFEQEKLRQKAQREADRAQEIRERLVIEGTVSESDKKWLDRYESQTLGELSAAK
ncbi:MAG: SMC-Scp complex subunit ScpB [Bdellovibrionales bacterium]|nr:SMC-Scp complex subunit ScpB [Bdellovibrionales bacterium]